MCEKDKYSYTKLKGHVLPRRIDICLIDQIKSINDEYRTVASCCGHGVFNSTIIIKTNSGLFMDYFTKTVVPYTKRRVKNFYKMDKKSGIYYIPVVEDYYRLLDI